MAIKIRFANRCIAEGGDLVAPKHPHDDTWPLRSAKRIKTEKKAKRAPVIIGKYLPPTSIPSIPRRISMSPRNLTKENVEGSPMVDNADFVGSG